MQIKPHDNIALYYHFYHHMQLSDLKNILEAKKGLLFIIFTSPHCTPCNNCRDVIHRWTQQFTVENTVIQFIDITKTENTILYNYYKNKRLLSGVPAIIMFTENNYSYLYNDSINTSNHTSIDTFFNKWLLYQRKQTSSFIH